MLVAYLFISCKIYYFRCEEKRGSSKFAVNRWDHMNVVMGKMLKKRGLKRTGLFRILYGVGFEGYAVILTIFITTLHD